MSSPSPFGPAPTLDSVRNGTAVIQFGQQGDSVKQVQFLVGTFDDGSFGNNTRTAISAFQAAQNISVTQDEQGKVNAATLVALETAYQSTAASLAKIDKRNKKVHLMLEFRRKLAALAERLTARGMEALITDGFRTFAEQDALFAQGRTAPGPVVTNARGGESNHNYGMACDMYPVIGGHVFTSPTPANKARFREIQKAIIDEAVALNLTSGSTFGSLGDMPHVQLLPENVFNAKSKAFVIFKQNGKSYDAVWKAARELL